MAKGDSNPADQISTEAAKKVYGEIIALKDATVPGMQKDLADIKAELKAIPGVDFKKTMTTVDKLEATMEKVKATIAANSRIKIAGLDSDDNRKKFSLLRAMVGFKKRDWKGAEYEKEVCEAAQEAIVKSGHVVGVDTQGGFMVPDQVIPDIIAAIYFESVFVALTADGTTRVSVLDGLTGIPARIPKFDGGMVAYWIGEQQNYIDSYTKMGNVTMTPKKLTALTRLTDEMMRFGSYGFETMLRNDMVRALAKALDFAVPYGLGTENQPKGLVQYALPTEPAGGQIKTWSAETKSTAFNSTDAGAILDFDGVQNMIGELEDDNITPNASFAVISAGRFFRQLKQLKLSFYNGQTTGQGYLLGVPMLTDDRLKDILGYTFAKSNQLPTRNKAGQSIGRTPANAGDLSYGDVFAGNFSEVVVGRWSGVEINDDGGTGQGFINDQTYVKAKLYVDIGLRQPRALIVCPDAKMR